MQESDIHAAAGFVVINIWPITLSPHSLGHVSILLTDSNFEDPIYCSFYPDENLGIQNFVLLKPVPPLDQNIKIDFADSEMSQLIVILDKSMFCKMKSIVEKTCQLIKEKDISYMVKGNPIKRRICRFVYGKKVYNCTTLVSTMLSEAGIMRGEIMLPNNMLRELSGRVEKLDSLSEAVIKALMLKYLSRICSIEEGRIDEFAEMGLIFKMYVNKHRLFVNEYLSDLINISVKNEDDILLTKICKVKYELNLWRDNEEKKAHLGLGEKIRKAKAEKEHVKHMKISALKNAFIEKSRIKESGLGFFKSNQRFLLNAALGVTGVAVIYIMLIFIYNKKPDQLHNDAGCFRKPLL